MDLSSPHTVLLSESLGSLLAVLAKVTRPLSGRELERLSGVSHSTALRTVRKLAEQGLVTVDEAGAGAVLLYSLNRKHVAAEAVLILVGLKRRLIDHLTAEISNWSRPPLHVSMFGSAARGDGGVSSDIDLLFVRPTKMDQEEGEWRRQLDELPASVLAWTGNHAGIVEISQDEVERLAVDNPQVLDELRRDSITIHGPSARDLFSRVA